MKSSFSFVKDGPHAAIIFENQKILRFASNNSFFGIYSGFDQVMVPGGTPEVAWVPIFSSYSGKSVADVKYSVEAQGERLRLRITPKAFQYGYNRPSAWEEEALLEVEQSESGRFVWRQEASLTIREAVTLDDPPEGLHMYRFHHQDDRPAHFYQFADPVPVNATGPAVPMLRDWNGIPEPKAGPDTFTKSWRRQYTAIAFENVDESFSWSDLNRQKWYHLTLDNRRARLCAAQGAFYLIKSSGEALRYRVDAPSHYHHVCEWGMDFHCWCDLDPFASNGVIPAGTTIRAATTVDLVDADVVEPVRAAAQPIELTAEELAIADRPAYEEPENSFARSALEHMDAQAWEPTSEGCRWERTGGYKPGSGVLIIENRYSDVGCWQQSNLGPAQWGNPFLAGARYRLSAWVKWDSTWNDPSQMPGPQIGVEFLQFNGPARHATITPVWGGWSESVKDPKAALCSNYDWQQVTLITKPCPAYVLKAVLKLRFSGRGTAWFSSVRWEIEE